MSENQLEKLKKENELLKLELQNAKINIKQSNQELLNFLNNDSVSIWEKDFSKLKENLDKIKDKGIKDIESYIKENPEDLNLEKNFLEIIKLNENALKSYGTLPKNNIHLNIKEIIEDESKNGIIDCIKNIYDNKHDFSTKFTCRTITNKKMYIHLKWYVSEKYRNTLKKVWISLEDITAHVQNNELIKNKLKYETLISEIAVMLNNSSIDKIDENITLALKKLCIYSNADKANIYLYSNNHSFGGVFYQWCRKSVNSNFEFLNKTNLLEYFKWGVSTIQNTDKIIINSIKDMPEIAVNEKKYCIENNVKSALFVSVKLEKKLYSVINLTFCKEEQSLLEEFVSPLKTIGSLLVNTLKRKEAVYEVQKEHDMGIKYFELANIIFVTLDNNFNILMMNNNGVKILGYDINDLLTINWIDNFVKDKDLVSEKLLDFSKNGNKDDVLNIEYSVFTKDGYEIIVDWHIIILYNAKGNADGFLCAGKDITEKIIIQKKLIQKEKMEAIGQLSGGIAHNFNNHLTSIMGYADILKEKLNDKKLIKYADTILKSSKKASDTVYNLLSFSRLGKYRNAPVNIHKSLIDTISILSNSIDKKISVIKEFNSSSSTIQGDENQIYNMFINLAINARNAMKNGGVLKFKTNLYNNDSKIFKKDGKFIEIIVQDSGIGISKENLSKIFEPFFTTNKNNNQTGLGLSSVYGTVKSHKGKIFVESEINKGTTFKIYLPLIEPKKPKIITKKVDFKDSIILCIDDEKFVRELLNEILEMKSYNIHTCSNGSSGIEYFDKNKDLISFVVLDLIMPGLSGLETFNCIKEMNPDIPVLIISGQKINLDIEKLLKNDSVDFLQKPFTANQFMEKIKKMKDKYNEEK